VADLVIKAGHEWSADRSKTTIEIDGLSRLQANRIVYEVIGPDAPREEPNGNFAIAAVLPTAMEHGRSLHYGGEVDSDFLEQIEENMAAWCRWRPDLFRPVNLSADVEAAPRLPRSRQAIMAFSGGLDSTFALHAHKHNLLGRRALDVQASTLIQGFDLALDDQSAFDMAHRHVKAILDSYGVRLNVVRTNWQKPFAVKWGMTHVLGIAAVLHLFHRQFGFGVFADDIPYEDQVTPWSSNAITNQMLGGGAYPIRSAGAAWSRTEKTAIIAKNPVVLDHIRVCYEHPELGENCGRCEKCLRTKLNFYANGVSLVPALGPRITVEDVRSIEIPRHAGHINSYVDPLQKGKWAANDPIRAELVELIRRYEVETGQLATKPAPRPKNVLQRAEKKLRTLIQGVWSNPSALNPFRPRSR
jgi:hypothetical protein